jgi:hypothetical protein
MMSQSKYSPIALRAAPPKISSIRKITWAAAMATSPGSFISGWLYYINLHLGTLGADIDLRRVAWKFLCIPWFSSLMAYQYMVGLSFMKSLFRSIGFLSISL